MASSIIQDGNGDTVIRLVLPELTIEAVFVVNLKELLSDTSLRRLDVQSVRNGINAVVVGETGNAPRALPLNVVTVQDNPRISIVVMFAHMCSLLCDNNAHRTQLWQH